MYNLGPLLIRVILLCSGYQLGCTIAAVSARRTAEHVKNTLQNITNERTPQSAHMRMHCNSPCLLLLVPQEHLLKVDDLVRPLQLPLCFSFAALPAAAVGRAAVVVHHLEGGAKVLSDGGTGWQFNRIEKNLLQ